jgi:hypothetical protein
LFCPVRIHQIFLKNQNKFIGAFSCSQGFRWPLKYLSEPIAKARPALAALEG